MLFFSNMEWTAVFIQVVLWSTSHLTEGSQFNKIQYTRDFLLKLNNQTSTKLLPDLTFPNLMNLTATTVKRVSPARLTGKYGSRVEEDEYGNTQHGNPCLAFPYPLLSWLTLGPSVTIQTNSRPMFAANTSLKKPVFWPWQKRGLEGRTWNVRW